MLRKHTLFYHILTRMKTFMQVCCFMTMRFITEKLSVVLSGFFHVFFTIIFILNVFFFIIQPDDANGNERNMLVNNNNNNNNNM
jgi:hypothetical protein